MLLFFHEKGRYQKNKVRETGRRRNSNLGCGVAGGKFQFLTGNFSRRNKICYPNSYSEI